MEFNAFGRIWIFFKISKYQKHISHYVKIHTTESKIIIHLSQYPYEKYTDGAVPFALTQEGIANSIGKSRNYIAVVLGRMLNSEKKLVFSELRYVKGSKKRRVYFLTNYGMKKASELIEKIKNEKIRIILSDGSVVSVYGKDLNRYFKGKNALVQAILKMDESSTINMITDDLMENTPFIGREQYLKKLRIVMEDAKKGRARCVFISGIPGIGKTALAIKAGELAKNKGFLVVMGKCYQNMDIPYYPLIKAMAQNREFSGVHSRFLRFAGSNEKDKEYVEFRRKEVWHEIVQEFKKITSKKPVMIIVDDIQWAGESTLELIRYLCNHLQNEPLLLVATHRDDFKVEKTLEDFDKYSNFLKFHLEPMTVENTRALIINIYNRNLDENTLTTLEKITRGIPLFVKEVVNAMKKEGIREYSTPTNFESSIVQRISFLDSLSAEILKMSSVIGQRFSKDFLESLVGSEEIQDSLEKLVSEGYLKKQPGNIYEFVHPLVRSAIYKTVNNPRKIHCKIANIAEEIKKEHPSIGYIINIGHHYEMCGNYENAIKNYIEQANKYMEKYAYEDYINLLERAYSLSKAGTPQREEIAKKLAHIYVIRGEYDKGIEKYKALLEMRKNMGHIYFKIAQAYRLRGDFEKALYNIENGLANAENTCEKAHLLGEKLWILLKKGMIKDAENILTHLEKIKEADPQDECLALYLENKATLYHYMGKYKEARIALESAIKIRESMDPEENLASMLTNLGILIAQSGDVKNAIPYFLKSGEIDRKYGNTKGLAQTYSNLGIAYTKLGLFDEALHYFQEAVNIYTRIESMDSLAVAYFSMGNVYAYMGNFKDAVEHFFKGKEIFESLGDMWGLCYACQAIGDSYIYAGKYPDGMYWLTYALEIARKTENMDCMVESYISMALAFSYEENHIVAKSMLNMARSLSEKLHDPRILPKIHFTEGLIELKKGDYKAAETLFEEALDGFKKIRDRIHISISGCLKNMAEMRMGIKDISDEFNEYIKEIHRAGMKYWHRFCNGESF